LRAELRLARSSALSLVWLGFGLVFFGVGAWLALTVAIALGVAEASGHPLLGVGTVAAINLAGAIWVLRAMRRCWHDLQLPRTRALIANSAAKSTDAKSPNESENPS
jgi:TRAP-type C4-dicarboxylate transport system permease small subunit